MKKDVIMREMEAKGRGVERLAESAIKEVRSRRDLVGESLRDPVRTHFSITFSGCAHFST
jgi:hypothetical protein